MPIPSKRTILKRISRNYTVKRCKYLPCHDLLETCSLCYCIFYPCENTALGQYIISSKGREVWSCMKCEWVHRKDTVKKVREFLVTQERRDLPPREMCLAFLAGQREQALT